MDRYYIYTHSCPITGVVRYVGKGSNKRAYRINTGRYGYHKNWLQSLKNKNKKPIINIILNNLSEENSLKAETLFIKHYRQFCPLTNLTDGGDGILNYKHTKETKDKQSKAAYKRVAKGIGYDSRCILNPWWARVKINNKRTYLGYFKTEEEALDACKKAKEEINK